MSLGDSCWQEMTVPDCTMIKLGMERTAISHAYHSIGIVFWLILAQLTNRGSELRREKQKAADHVVNDAKRFRVGWSPTWCVDPVWPRDSQGAGESLLLRL